MKRTKGSLPVALAVLLIAAVACGTSESGEPDSGSDGGTDAGYDGGDAGYDGGTDAGYDGGTDAGYDGGTDAGYDGGTDAGYDGGSDAGYDGGSDAGYDGGSDAGYDGGTDAGVDGGTDAGTDGGTAALDCVLCHTSATLSAAHAVHIDGGSASSAFSCSECHTLYTSASHQSGTAVINFATASGDIANLGGLSPAWSAATTTCSNVYCHGNGSALLSGSDAGVTITDGTVTGPNWSKTDGSQNQCTSCHGDPPVANSHIQCTSDFCNVCHVDALEGGLMVPSLKLHVNGVVDVMAESLWGTNDHGLGTPPPGHDTGNVDFSTCVVCHGPTPAGISEATQEVMTCTSCHPAGGP